MFDNLKVESDSNHNKNDAKLDNLISKVISRWKRYKKEAQVKSQIIDLEHASPEVCIRLIENPGFKLFSTLLKVIKLSLNERKKWITEFIESGGIFKLISSIENQCEVLKSKPEMFDTIVLLKCLKCLQELMNSRLGMESLIKMTLEDNTCVDTFVKACTSENVLIKREMFLIMSAMAIYSEEGYTLVLKTLDAIKANKKQKYRYAILVNELKSNSNGEICFYLATLMGLINCLISQMDKLKDRLDVRSELKMKLKEFSRTDLAIQIDQYESSLLKDENEAMSLNALDQNDIYEVFHGVCIKLQQSELSQKNFLQLMKNILNTADNDETQSLEKGDSIKLDEILDKLNKFAEKLIYEKNFESFQNNAPIITIGSRLISKLNEINDDKNNHVSKVKNEEVLKEETENCDNNFDELNVSLPASFPLISLKTIVKFNSSSKALIQRAVTPPSTPILPQIDSLLASSYIPPPAPPPPPLLQSLLINAAHQTPLIAPTVAPSPPPPPPSLLSKSNIPPPPPPFLFSQSNIPPPPPPMMLPFLGNKNAPSLTFPPLQFNAQSNNDAFIYHHIPRPNKPVKNLNWRKINQIQIENEENIWKKVNAKKSEIDKLNFSVLEDIILKQNSQKETDRNNDFDKVTSRKLTSVSKSVEIKKFLDPKRENAYNFFLHKIKTPLHDYVNLIRDGNFAELGSDNLNCLAKILPEKTEVKEIQEHFKSKPDLNVLSKPEQFVKLLSDLPCYELRINLMIFIEEFDDVFTRLETALKTYAKCAETILTNEHLLSFYAYVLAIGNYMNTGTYNGQVAGFKISSLTKLAEFKTNKPSVTLLHFLVDQVTKTEPHILSFVAELKDLSLIQNASVKNLTSDFNLLKKSTQDLTSQVNDPNNPDEIRLTYSETLKILNDKIASGENLIEQIETFKTRLIASYCEDPTCFDFEDFMRVFYEFCQSVSRAVEENKERIIKEENMAKRKKELEEVEIKRNTVKTDDSDEDSNNIFSLITKNIQKGNFTRRQLKSPRVADCRRPRVNDRFLGREITIQS